MSPVRKLPQGYPKKRPVARNLTGPSLYVSTFASYLSPQNENVRFVQSRNVRPCGPPFAHQTRHSYFALSPFLGRIDFFAGRRLSSPPIRDTPRTKTNAPTLSS